MNIFIPSGIAFTWKARGLGSVLGCYKFFSLTLNK